MLRAEPAVPVHLGVVEAKKTSFLCDFDVEVRRAGKKLVGESAIGVLRPDEVSFIDYGADDGVFVQEDSGNEVFVREVVFAEVEVRC